ncbi:MAG TPA: NAD(P)/FAD-dependent oxidoreductase [Oscillospiraceae bacterium]|nr:NAD(P)/FAD-dependent oxidoreductase [Oscillospiraceae bacterium]
MGNNIIVVGAGPSGMMAALTAAESGASVALVERNEKAGRKLYITGKGRCNLTNDCTAAEALENVPHNSRFLYGAMTRFPPAATKEKFTALGVPLKTERGRRVFPVSDRSADVIDALVHALRRAGVRTVHAHAEGLLLERGAVRGVRTDAGDLRADAVVLATGGRSYPATGSTGDGYVFARQAGHTVMEPRPSLVPLEIVEEDCARMQGLSLRNVSLKVKNQKKKVVYEGFGEMLFTHFGVSGPLILSASAHMRELGKESYRLIIDLKPALDEKALDARLLREFAENPNRDFQNVLSSLVHRLMIPVVLARTGVAPETKANSVTREERRRLLELLKGLTFTVRGARPIEEAIVSSGGVKVSEIDPSTMASKLVRGLYFAGELIDVDAYTGGFNLQISWATGHLAGESAAKYNPVPSGDKS